MEIIQFKNENFILIHFKKKVKIMIISIRIVHKNLTQIDVNEVLRKEHEIL